ncbi:MAG: hypothetical protein WBO08_11025 [Mycobacterium sp.]|nr:hypothetical protein [Mycobacterium sp.]
MTRAATPTIAALLADGAAHEILRHQHSPRAESFGDGQSGHPAIVA